MNSIIKYILLSCSLWATALLFSQVPQNIIFNPSFEEHRPSLLCGSGASITRLSNGEAVYGWNVSTYGTPDYYATCDMSGFFGIPSNWKGFQDAIDGERFVGGYFSFSKTNYWKSFYEETIQGTLLEPLKPHQGYCFSFYYAIGDNEYNNCTLDTLRFYFANTDTFFLSQVTDTTHFMGVTSYWVSNSEDLYGKHQIEIPIGHITDTANWHFMESHFKAKGGEKFMIGGVFKDDSFVKYKESSVDSFYDGGNKNFPDSVAYLYFDMFNLYECDEYGLGDHKIRLPNVFTPNGDGINDTYFIHDYLPPGFEFKVYNRWGSLVYQNDNYQNEWSPKDISDGTYWVIAKNPDSGTLFKQLVTVIKE